MSRRPAVRTAAPVVGAPAVALAIADFLVRTERERLRLFSEHLRSTVLQVSPLLLDFAAMEQVDLAAATALMQPPRDWPWRRLYDPPNPVMRQWRARQLLLGQDAERGAGRFRRAFADPGVVIRSVDHPRGRFGIRPRGGVLGFAASLGPCRLSVFGDVAMIRLPEPLPETLVMAMPGRRLGDLIDHPLFRGREYKVRSVVTDPTDDLPVLTFRAGLVPVPMSWMADAGAGL